jgi:hypothetical protein
VQQHLAAWLAERREADSGSRPVAIQVKRELIVPILRWGA